VARRRVALHRVPSLSGVSEVGPRCLWGPLVLLLPASRPFVRTAWAKLPSDGWGARQGLAAEGARGPARHMRHAGGVATRAACTLCVALLRAFLTVRATPGHVGSIGSGSNRVGVGRGSCVLFAAFFLLLCPMSSFQVLGCQRTIERRSLFSAVAGGLVVANLISAVLAVSRADLPCLLLSKGN
jgi:hypothetical protein